MSPEQREKIQKWIDDLNRIKNEIESDDGEVISDDLWSDIEGSINDVTTSLEGVIEDESESDDEEDDSSSDEDKRTIFDDPDQNP